MRSAACAPSVNCHDRCIPETHSVAGLQALREILAQVPNADGPSGEPQPRGRPRSCAPGSEGESARALLQMWPSAERCAQAEPRGRQGARSAGALNACYSRWQEHGKQELACHDEARPAYIRMHVCRA